MRCIGILLMFMLLATALIDPGTVIAVESPTYLAALQSFQLAGARFVPVASDADGVDPDDLARVLVESRPTALYLVPTFANPSGQIMSLGHRQRLIRLARKYDALVVTDDVYDMLQWSSDPEEGRGSLDRAVLPRMVDVDRDLDGGPIDEIGNAVSNGSFSKIVAPGCRTGWAEAMPALAFGISQTGSSRSGGARSHRPR